MADPLFPNANIATPSEPIDFLARMQADARAKAAMSLDENPDDAARAVQVGDSLGVPSSLVHTDLENYERQAKSRLVSEMLRNNQHLTDYVNSHPLAPVISNDDWANLDTISDSIKKLPWYTPPALQRVLKAGDTAAQEAFGEEPLLSPYTPPSPDNRLEFAMQRGFNYPIQWGVGNLARLIFERGFPAITMGAAGVLGQTAAEFGIKAGPDVARTVAEAAMDPGLYESLEPTLAQFPPAAAADAVIATLMKRIHDRMVGQGELKKLAPEELQKRYDAIDKGGQQVGEALRAADPWTSAGVEPPTGVHPLIDQLHAERAKADAEAFDEVMKNVQDSLTFQRNPELFRENFLTSHPQTDGHIGISAEGIEKLYPGEELPAAGDGKLGDIAGIRAEVERAKGGGGDVHVSTRDWLTVDPDVAKEVHDDLRLRNGGFTLEEAKDVKPATLAEDKDDLTTRNFYHGTDREFDRFEPQWGEQGAHFFTESPRAAGNYAESKAEATGGSAQIRPVRLNIRNPKYIDQSEYEKYAGLTVDHDLIRELEGQGYDSVILKRDRDFHRPGPGDKAGDIQEAMVWDPDKIIPKFGIQAVKDAAGLKPATQIGPKEFVPIDKILEGIQRARTHVDLTPPEAQPIKPGTKYDNKDLGAGHTFPAKALLNQIDPEHLTGTARALHEFFRDRLGKLAGDTPVYVIDTSKMREIAPLPDLTYAFYDTAVHSIFLPKDAVRGGLDQQRASQVIMEEISHAATAKAIINDDVAQDYINRLREFTIDHLKKNSPAEYTAFKYALSNPLEMVAWSQAHPGFQKVLMNIPLHADLARKLGMGPTGRAAGPKTAWEAVRAIVKDLWQRLMGREVPATVMDAMFRVGEQVEQIQKEMKPGLLEATKNVLTRSEGPTPSGAGITKKEHSRYLELMQKENDELMEAQRKHGEEVERVRQTAEWKANEAGARQLVDADLKRRPDIVADRALREGAYLKGQSRRTRFSLDASALTAEQRKGLHPDYFTSNKIVGADVLAKELGYQTGDQMIAQLTRLENERRMEDLTPNAHYKQLLDRETERYMQTRFGDLQQNILVAANDHILSPTVLDRLHEEMVAIGMQAHGEGFKIDKEQVKAWAKKSLNEIPMGEISSKEFLATSGRAGRELEKALLDEKATDAFKFAQQRYINTYMAWLASQAEKARKSFENNIVPPLLNRKTSWSTSQTQEHVNWLHDILSRTGFRPKRTAPDLRRELAAGDYKTLRDFVKAKNDNKDIWSDDEVSFPVGAKMPVAEFLLSDNYRKPIDQMTLPEFKDYVNSIKAIVKDGRDDKKILVSGDKKDLDELIRQMIEQMQRAMGDDFKARAATPIKPGATSWLGAMLLRPESWFNRLDLDNPRGIFNQSVVRRLMESENRLAAMEKEKDKEFRQFWTWRPTGKAVENRLFKDTDGQGNFGGFMGFTDENVMAVLANVGNALNHMKLSRGYGVAMDDKVFEARTHYGYRMWMRDPVMEYLFQHTTKEDWDRQQAMGNFFQGLFEESAHMYRRMSGVAPERIELTNIETPWGDYKGWYHPLIADPIRAKIKGMDMNPMEESGFFRPTPASGYTKGRTGAIYPLLLTFNAVPFKIKTMLNDIALREAVTDVYKIFDHPGFRDAFTRNFGEAYYKELVPWLQDIVGKRSYQTVAQKGWLTVAEFARENIINQLIGLNPGTVMKHGPTAAILSMREVGVDNFARWFAQRFAHNPETGERWDAFAFRNSEELQRRARTWVETTTGGQMAFFPTYSPGRVLTATQKERFDVMRKRMQWIGAAPVAFSDYLSAVPTWLAAYDSAMKEGVDHGEAVFEADRAVRHAHGSTAMAARAKVMRLGPMGQYLVPFYNFFNTVLNLKYEEAWKAKLVLEKRAEAGLSVPDLHGQIDLHPSEWQSDRSKEYLGGAKGIPSVIGYFFATTIAVAAVEELVDPLSLEKKESEFSIKHLAKVLAFGEGSSWPIGRDVVNAVLRQGHATAGIYTTAYDKIQTFLNDLQKDEAGMDPTHAAKTIRDFNFIVGLATGLTNEELGKVGQFTVDHIYGKAKPIQGPGDLYFGARQGKPPPGQEQNWQTRLYRGR